MTTLEQTMKVAKTFQRQVYALNKLKKNSRYANIGDFALKKVQTELGHYDIWTKRGNISLTKLGKLSAKQLRTVKRKLTEATKMPTMTKRGYDKIINERLNTFNRTMRLNDPDWVDLTLEEFENWTDEINSGGLKKEYYLDDLIHLNEIKRGMADNAKLKTDLKKLAKKKANGEKQKEKLKEELTDRLVEAGLSRTQLKFSDDVVKLAKVALKILK